MNCACHSISSKWLVETVSKTGVDYKQYWIGPAHGLEKDLRAGHKRVGCRPSEVRGLIPECRLGPRFEHRHASHIVMVVIVRHHRRIDQSVQLLQHILITIIRKTSRFIHRYGFKNWPLCKQYCSSFGADLRFYCQVTINIVMLPF